MLSAASCTSAKSSPATRSHQRNLRNPIPISSAKQIARTGSGHILPPRLPEIHRQSATKTAQFTKGTVTYLAALAAVKVGSAGFIRPAAVAIAVKKTKTEELNRITAG